MNSDAPASRGKMLALLRAGPFRRYIIGSAISDTGTEHTYEEIVQGKPWGVIADGN